MNIYMTSHYVLFPHIKMMPFTEVHIQQNQVDIELLVRLKQHIVKPLI